MLEDSLFESRRRRKTRNPLTVAVSVMAHVVTITVLVLVPLLQTQAITIPKIDTSLFLPRIEKQSALPVFSAQRQVPQKHSDTPSEVFTPVSIPQQVAFVDAPPISDIPFFPTGGGNGTVAILSKISGAPFETAAPVIAPPSPPPPPPPPTVVNAKPLRISDGGQAANLIYQVKPPYPTLAKITHTQGVVVLEAVIKRDGSIESVRVVSGHPLLTQAALDAVKQWKYRPTLLNGEPIEVITTVTVTFTLQ